MRELGVLSKSLGINFDAGIVERIVDSIFRECQEITNSMRTISKVSPQLFRTTESAWIGRHYKELQTKYGGEWIVVEGESLVAHDVNLIRADKSARAKGISIPFLVRIFPGDIFESKRRSNHHKNTG